MIPLSKPTVNLNGTSRSELIAQNMAVANAARALIEAMAQATPHPRDYPLGNHPNARVAHNNRWRAVAAIEDEYIKLALAIHKGEDE